jgi:hypothetical protein
MTRELHVYGHSSRGMVAIIFVESNGAVEAFDINGLTSMGRFGSVAEAAACACADTDWTSLAISAD